jgi:hypothetical protein
MIITRSRASTAALTCAVFVSLEAGVAAQSGLPLKQLQFDIVGVRLVVDPPALTVPKNIPTHINTQLVTPPEAGAAAQEALAGLTSGAVIEAELRGPAIPPTRIVVPVGSPIPIPAFALPGDYFLDGIRLMKDGKPLLDATAPDGRSATLIPIRVISEVFVTSVTSRPLTLDEIREKGIIIDQSSFQAVNFQAAFNIDGQPFTIQLPAVLPTAETLSTTADRTELIRQVTAINQTLAATHTTLPPEFDRPGINFSIAALPFFFVPEDESDIPPLDVPPVNGLVVIAGNVAFLNQFFKVSVLVANVTPEGSQLLLRDVSGTIVLPTGLDRIPGTTEAPGDDPLRLARVEGVGAVGTVPVLQTGPDGVLGTADDSTLIPPQKQGEGELLLEGLKEGGHTFDVNIEAFLDGLPSGPVRLVGLAAGAVFVRNPTFSVTLAHPRTIRSGENYDLYATVTNTSRSVANLVSVNLDPLSISGAQLLSDPTVTFEKIEAGQSATARFTLRAQQTGEVTFSSFTGEAASGGGIRLFTGIGERNVPLSPNAIVLPTTTNALPAALVAAAQRVLGQAFSIATAPPEALPPDVLFVKRQTVIDRGLELALAGERVQFGEPLERVVQDLLLDWLGGSSFDAGFDQLMRTTDAGASFMQALADVLGPPIGATGALTFQQGFAEIGAARAASHISAIGIGPAGADAAQLTVTRADGTGVAAGGPESTTMAGAGALALIDGALAVLAQVIPQRHVFELTAAAAGPHDLGIVIPGPEPGVLRQLRYAGIALGTGGTARVEIDLSAPGDPLLRTDANGDGSFEGTLAPQSSLVTEPAPQVLAVRQLESSFRTPSGDPKDPATYGLILGVMLNKPVTTASAQLKTNYSIDNNQVIGASLQSSGRLVYLYLQKPVGGLTPRSLGISGITDLRGALLPPATVPIQMFFADGAHVFGQVREAGGGGVPNAVLRLRITTGPQESFDVATIQVDGNGSFDFDFVPRIGQYFTLTAQHPVTRDLTSISSRVRGAGEQLLLNPTFTGRGTVRGRLLATDGTTPLPNIPVALIPGAVLGIRGFVVRTNEVGEFQFNDVPVGVFTLSASDGAGGFAQSPGLLPSAGQIIVQDLVLVAQPESAGLVTGRVFLADGITPGTGFTVYVGRYDRQNASIAAVDSTTTDASGSFTFARGLPPNSYDVVAVDPATGQLGTSKVSVLANVTSSLSIVLESTGNVEGVVRNAQGQPVAGAVIAGGLALGTADANGFFRITGVPAGSRTIEAGDPVTKRRGSATVTVVPGQTVSVAITLEARATITGRVVDANGNPMPRVSVRLPVLGGFTFVFTNNQGVYTFPDLPLGSYLIQAPGPSVDSLIQFMEFNGMDPASAFTSGDGPPPAEPLSSADANAVLAAYQEAVKLFLSVDESLLGLPIADVGGFGFTKVQLFQDSTTVVADLKFLSQGQVGGRTEDSEGRPTGAVVRVIGLAVSLTGFPILKELGRMNSDAASGAFLFSGIPRFDLATFQTAGVRGGDFTLDAAQPFSPAILTFRSQLNTANPNLTDIVLRFPPATETNGTISGQVFLTDGNTPAGANTRVEISFGDLTVMTGPDGRFQSLLPIPAGTYTITATAPNGLRGQATARVPAGGNVDVQVRLLGLGAAAVVVRRPNGVPVSNAIVRLERATFPGDRADGRTDVNGAVQFVNLTEGPVGVIAEEEGTGLMGRASGVIARDSSVTIPLTITASGRVTGRFLTVDGSQGVPFAQVTVSSGGVQAFTNTDSDGRFEVVAVPVGRFSVEGHDPLTGRLGRATGELQFEGQTVDVTLLQVPRGTVAGLVLNADGATAVAAAHVRLTSSSIIRTDLQATARLDGSFRFEGVPEGAFEIEATDPVSGFKGRGTGRITAEGELVDVAINLDPFGAIRVFVRSFDGQPAGNATATLSGPVSRTAAVDANGTFTFEHLPLGQYTVVARSLANSGDGGQGQATIEAANQTADAVVQMRGTGTVTVRVVQADGTSPVASASVGLTAKASFGSDPPGPVSGTFNGFTDALGNATFSNVPIGDFFARGESAALAGVATGTLPAPNGTASVTVQLGASGAISGRVLLPDGLTPAAQSIVTLRFQSQSQLQSGVLQVTTGVGGTFEFSGIPLGTFTLSAFELVSSGVRTLAGSIGSNGQHVALGDIVLDNAGPRVVDVDPDDGVGGVAVDATVVITFSEPIDPASLRVTGANPNAAILLGDTAVPLAPPVFSDANRKVTLRTTGPLVSAAQYVLSLAGAPDGVKDASAFSMTDPFVSTFLVRDAISPAIMSVSPANDALGILPEAVVRVAFSEPIATGVLTLRNAAGASVPGTQAFSGGNTVLVFSPQDFLQPNTFYTAVLSNVSDGAGNALAGGALTSRFFTVDTLAPVITALQFAGTPRAGSTISVQPVISAQDTARVEYRFADGAASVSTVSPFAITVTLPAADSMTVSAVGVDQVGNRSAPFEQSIQIQTNAAPVVTLTNVTGSSQVSQGQSLTFQVRATDDGDLAQILFSAVGAVSASHVQQVTAAQSDVTTSFNLTIPQTAASNGTITVQAAAVDAGGLQSVPATMTLTVRDAINPLVTIVTPVNNAVVVPGQSLDVVVDVSDDVAVATVAMLCTPQAAGCESRTLPGSTTVSRQTFSIIVPEGLQAPQTVALSILATDVAGNTATGSRVLRIADALKPTITDLHPVSGSTQVVAGTTVAVRANVTDNVGVTALVFSTTGAVVTEGTSVVAPPVMSGSAVFTFAVPAGVSNGSTITVTARARDAAGNLSDAATMVLTVGDMAAPIVEFLEPAPGAAFNPGQTITVRVRSSDDTAVQRVTLTAAGPLTASETRDIAPATTPVEITFSLNVPAGTAPGQITLTAQATDVAGVSSNAVQRTVTVNDVIAPQVRIVSPAADALVDPRQPVQITVEATDAIGVTRVAFAASGTLSASESRNVTPPATARSEVFTLTVTPHPVAGGTVTLNATARDAAGNQGNATAVTFRLQDVVPPDVASTVPADGATGIDQSTAVNVRFTEPMDRTTLTAANIRLRRGADVIAAAIAIAPTDDEVTLTPTLPLPLNAAISIVVSSAVRDVAGNTMTADRQATFTTASPDSEPPRVSSTSPVAGAIDVPLVAPVVVTFSEAIDPGTVTPQSFRVLAGGAALSGTLSVTAGETQARFTPDAPYAAETVITAELTDAITDRFGNALVNTDGSALTAPFTFSFTTSRFSLTSPVGDQVIENAQLTLEARASAGSGITSVEFTVNGQPLPVVTSQPFVRTFNVGAAASTPTLTIVASGRNASGVEIARDERTFDVVVGIAVSPSLSGVPLGGNSRLRFSVSSALGADLPISLTAGDPALVSFPVNPVVLPAGQLHVDAEVTGVATGATAIIGRSTRGEAAAIVAVSPVLSGMTLTSIPSELGLGVLNPPSSGYAVLSTGDTVTVAVPVLIAASATETTVEVVSTNGSVATATAAPIAAGATTALIEITSITDGVATLIIRAGGHVRGITVFVGSLASAPLLVAQPAGTSVLQAPAAGQVLTTTGVQSIITVPILSTAAAAPVPVTVSSLDPSIAIGASGGIDVGETTATITITGLTNGTTTLIVRAGDVVRAIAVTVGAPAPGSEPLIVARPVGLGLTNAPSAGHAVAAVAGQTVVTMEVLSAAAPGNTAVTVLSSNDGVATGTSTGVIAGATTASLTINGISDGVATLIIRAGTEVRGLTVFVGSAAAAVPAALAPPAGISVAALPTLGRLFVPSTTIRTIGVQLFGSPVTTDTSVNVSTSNASVAAVTGAVTVRAGEQVANVDVTTGDAGIATLTFESGGFRAQLTIAVGLTPDANTPAVVAAPVGISVMPNPSMGRLFGAPGAVTVSTVGIPLLETAATEPTEVTVSSGNPAVALVGGAAATTGTIAVGERVLTVTIGLTGTQGAALLTLEFNGLRRELLVIVGDPPASEIPAVVAPIVGIQKEG